MQIVGRNLVLLGRSVLRVAALAGVAGVCDSCAIFPPNGGAGFTSFTFTFQVAGQINPNFVYDVAITTSDVYPPQVGNLNPGDTAPVPVINSNNPNGRMAGSPNIFIEYTGPTTGIAYTLYQFALSSQFPNKNDPTNPVNLGVYPVSQLGTISQYQDPEFSGQPNTIQFTIYTNELAPTAEAAKALAGLQVNILPMTRVANQGSGTRIIDALGNSSTVQGLSDYLDIDLRTTQNYNNNAGFEPTGDTFGGTDPDVDIINYNTQVTPVTGQGTASSASLPRVTTRPRGAGAPTGQTCPTYMLGA